VPREDLRNSAPADIFDQHPLFLVGRASSLVVQLSDQVNRRKIVAALLFQRSFADAILRTDAVVARI
jgi:hypothetical protein